MEPELQRDFITGEGMTISFLRRPGNVPLILLHGLGGRGNNWLRLIPLLSSEWDIILPDLLGHGKSEKKGFGYTVHEQAEAIRFLIEMLGLSDFVIGGNSYGGWVSLMFASGIMSPKRLILEDSAGINPTVGEAGEETVSQFVERVMKMNPMNSEQIIREIVRMNSTGLERLSESELSRISSRTFIIWGTEDKLIPLKYGIELNRLIRDSTLHRIEGAGHIPHWTHPKEVAQVMDSVLP